MEGKLEKMRENMEEENKKWRERLEEENRMRENGKKD